MTENSGPPPSSVTGGLGGAGANSETTPETRTSSPTAGLTVAPLVKTNSPSEVDGLPIVEAVRRLHVEAAAP